MFSGRLTKGVRILLFIILFLFLVGPQLLSPFVSNLFFTLERIPRLPLDVSEEEVDRVILRDGGSFRIVCYRSLLPFLDRYEVLDSEGFRVACRKVIFRVLVVSAMQSENVTSCIRAVDFENLREVIMVVMDVEGELRPYLSTFNAIIDSLSTIEENELYQIVVTFKPEVDSIFREIRSMFRVLHSDLARWVEVAGWVEMVLSEAAGEIWKVQQKQGADLELLYYRLGSVDCIDTFYNMIVNRELLSSLRSYIQSLVARLFDLEPILELAPENVKDAAKHLIEDIKDRILIAVNPIIDYLENIIFSRLMAHEELSERLLLAKKDLTTIREVADKRLEEIEYPANLSNNARQMFFIYSFIVLFLAVETYIIISDYRSTYEVKNRRKIAFNTLLSLVISTPLILALSLVDAQTRRLIEISNSMYLPQFPTPTLPLQAPSTLWGLALLIYYVMLPMYSYVYPLSFNDIFFITPIPILQYSTFILYSMWLILAYAILRSAFQDEESFTRSSVTMLVSYAVTAVIGGIDAYILSLIVPDSLLFLASFYSFLIIAYSLPGLINREFFYLSLLLSLISFSTMIISGAAWLILHGSNALHFLLGGLLLLGGAGTAFLFPRFFTLLPVSNKTRRIELLAVCIVIIPYVLLVLLIFSYAWACIAVFGESAANTIMFSFLIVALLFGFHAALTTLVWRISGKICNLIRRDHKYSRKHSSIGRSRI